MEQAPGNIKLISVSQIAKKQWAFRAQKVLKSGSSSACLQSDWKSRSRRLQVLGVNTENSTTASRWRGRSRSRTECPASRPDECALGGASRLDVERDRWRPPPSTAGPPPPPTPALLSHSAGSGAAGIDRAKDAFRVRGEEAVEAERFAPSVDAGAKLLANEVLDVVEVQESPRRSAAGARRNAVHCVRSASMACSSRMQGSESGAPSDRTKHASNLRIWSCPCKFSSVLLFNFIEKVCKYNRKSQDLTFSRHLIASIAVISSLGCLTPTSRV